MALISIDKERLEAAAEKLTAALAERKGIFSYCPPEERLFRGLLPKLQAQALFISVALDSMRPSERVYAAGLRILETPLEEIAGMPRAELEGIVGRHFDNGIQDPARIVSDCAMVLTKYYGGDPANMFSMVNSFDAARRLLLRQYEINGRQKKIHGMGKQKAALMIKNFQRFGLMHLKDRYDCPPKIDRHYVRQMIGSGAASPAEHGNYHMSNFVPSLEKASRELCRSRQMDPIALDDAKWIVGSQLCTQKNYAVCEEYCPLQCAMLVKLNRSGSYVAYPSEVRSKKGIQLRLL